MPFTDDDIASDQLQSNSSPAHRARHNNVNAALRQLFSLAYDAREYNADPDSSSDELAHLQDAVDACAAAGGGIVRLLPGEYLVSDQLVVESSVIIEGAGQEATILKRTGNDTSPIVYFRTPDGADEKIFDCGLRRLTIDGNSKAVNAVQLTTVNSGDFHALKIKGGTAWQILMDCWDDRPVGGDARDNQDNQFRRIRLECSGSQGGMKLNGSPTLDATTRGNSSLNRLDGIMVSLVDGDAFFFGNSDGNVSTHLRLVNNGSGRGLVLGAGSFAGKGHARHNQFYGIQMSTADVYALAGTTDSDDNIIYGLSKGNGGSAPNISSGATLWWQADDGTGNL